MDDRETRPDELRAWLRRGDPALDGRDPTAEEIRKVRAKLLAQGELGGRELPGHPRLWVSAAATAILVLAAALFLMTANRDTSLKPRRRADAGSLAARPARTARSIQMTAPGGTRIIWQLEPGDPDENRFPQGGQTP